MVGFEEPNRAGRSAWNDRHVGIVEDAGSSASKTLCSRIQIPPGPLEEGETLPGPSSLVLCLMQENPYFPHALM